MDNGKNGNLFSSVSFRLGCAVLFLLIVGGLFFYVNCKAFMVNDDVLYALAQECVGSKQLPLPAFLSFLPFDSISLPVAHIADYRVSSVAMLLNGWLVSPWCDNVRLGNYMARLFIFLGDGRALFNIVNTLAGIACIAVFAKIAFRKISFVTLSVALFVFLLCCPGLEPTCVWVAGSCNYLWGCCLLGAFLLGVYRIRCAEKVEKKCLCLTCLLAAACGFQHEGLSSSLMAMLAILFLFEKANRRVWCVLACCVFLTMSACLLSPGNIARMKGASGVISLESILGTMESVLEVLAIPLLLLLSIMLATLRQRGWRQLLSAHLPVFAFTGVSLLLLVYSIRGATWGIAGPAFYPSMGLILCILILLNRMSRPMLRLLSVPCALLSVCVLGGGAYVMARDAAVMECIVERMRGGQRVIVVDDYVDTRIPPSWHAYEMKKIVSDAWKWPMVKTVYGIDKDMEMPVYLHKRLMPKEQGYSRLDLEPQEQPCFCIEGNLVTIRLPRGTKALRKLSVHVERNGFESDIPVKTMGTLATLPHEIAQSLTSSKSPCLQSDDFRDGFYFCNLRLPDECRLSRISFALDAEGEARYWTITPDGIHSGNSGQ